MNPNNPYAIENLKESVNTTKQILGVVEALVLKIDEVLEILNKTIESKESKTINA